MNQSLFGRALGITSPQNLASAETSRLFRCLQAAPGLRFNGDAEAKSKGVGEDVKGSVRGDERAQGTSEAFVASEEQHVWAHRAGVNSLVIDRFEGRYPLAYNAPGLGISMLSGGASSTILLWDLESKSSTGENISRPVGRIDSKNAPGSHKFGVTHLTFYPFDSAAFLSSSYDHNLKIYATETMAPSATFDLGSVIYSHALSPIADHLLVACATQHPAVRMVDLRTGDSAQSLAGHKGAVLSVAWSPVDEYVLASGGVDGTVRLWDVRRSAGCLGVLDLEDAVGMGGEDGFGKNARAHCHGRAHVGACNGVVWTDDARYIVTAGHDERVRVWDVDTGANVLSHFGPIIKNTNLSTLLPLVVPSHVGKSEERFMIYPNEKEILMFDLLEGTLLKRLRIPSPTIAQANSGSGQRNTRTRVTSLAWRAGDIEFYSAHSDGMIRVWKARTSIDVELDREAALGFNDDEDEGRKRKRQALDEIFRDLTKQKITFT